MALLVRRRPKASPPAVLAEPTGSTLPMYESANNDTVVQVGLGVGPLPPTYEAVLEEGTMVKR
jgi:hypothetical protein